MLAGTDVHHAHWTPMTEINSRNKQCFNGENVGGKLAEFILSLSLNINLWENVPNKSCWNCCNVDAKNMQIVVQVNEMKFNILVIAVKANRCCYLVLLTKADGDTQYASV